MMNKVRDRIRTRSNRNLFGTCARSAALSLAVFAGGNVSALEGITTPYDTAGTTKTESGTITGTASDVIQVQGGGTLSITGLSNTGYLGNWEVASGTTLMSDNDGNAKETTDRAFGAGTIQLNGGTLKVSKASGLQTWLRRVSNNLVINGSSFLTSTGETELYLYGNISGSGNIKESVSYSLYLLGDNSAYTGNWELSSDWTWVNSSASNVGTVASADYSFGSGTVTVTGGGIGMRSTDALIKNNIVQNKAGVWYKNGNSVTFTGKITGDQDWTVNSTSTPRTNLQGDGSGYTKNWIIDGTASNVTVSSDNNSAGNNGVDPRFGSGDIYLKGGTSTTATLLGTKHATYICNDIIVSGSVRFNSNSDVEMYFTGNISGSGTITEGVTWSMFVTGNNSAYTGDWVFTGDYVGFTNDGTNQPEGSDLRFGSGTIYLDGGGIRTQASNSNTRGFINTNITVRSGQQGNFRYGPFTLTGNVTVDGTLASDTGNGNPILTIGDTGVLQGNGKVTSRIVAADGSTLTGGTLGTAGTLTFNNSLELQKGSAIQMDVMADGSSDSIVVNGGATVSKDILVNILFDENFTPSSGWKADVFTVNGTGSFEEGFDWGKIIHLPDYYDLVLGPNGSLSIVGNAAALPEPSAYILLLLGIAGGMWMKRKEK